MPGGHSEGPKVPAVEIAKNPETDPERFSAEEIMRTPSIRMVVAGTVDGLQTPSTIEVAEGKDGILKYVWGPTYDNPDEVNVIEIGGTDDHALKIKKAIDKDGAIVIERFAKGYRYRGLFVASRDLSKRVGHKAVIIGWPQNNEMLDKKMTTTLEPTDEGARVFLKIWKEIYANDNLWKEEFKNPRRTGMEKNSSGEYVEIVKPLKTYFEPPEKV